MHWPLRETLNFKRWFEENNEFLTEEQKRYNHVEFYSRKINIFARRFLVVVCPDATFLHWFVAIICNDHILTVSTARIMSEIHIMDLVFHEQRAEMLLKIFEI